MSDPKSLEDKEFQVATAILEDQRRFIAAHKIQRWDVVKWGVSVNLALTVAAATPALADIRFYLFLLGCGVTVASWRLVLHYNQRMTAMRSHALTIINWLKQRRIDYDSIIGFSSEDAYASRENYDRQELRWFSIILAVSPGLILLSLFLTSHHPSP